MSLSNSDYWKILNTATSTSNWKSILSSYDNNPQIDVNYAPEDQKGMTILFLACLHNQFTTLVDHMIHRQPKADFAARPLFGPHQNKSMILLAAVAKARAIVAHMLGSGQVLDLTIAPVPGLTVYFAMTNYQWWDHIEKLHTKHSGQLTIDIAPKIHEGHSPLWLACSYGKLKTVKQMLIIQPVCNINLKPKDQKSALLHIFECTGDLRLPLIKTFLFLGAEMCPYFNDQQKTEYISLKEAQKKILEPMKLKITANKLNLEDRHQLINALPLLATFPESLLVEKIRNI